VFHLNDPAERNVMYERVIREATQADDLRSYRNEADCAKYGGCSFCRKMSGGAGSSASPTCGWPRSREG
jgi:hypothetical protein